MSVHFNGKKATLLKILSVWIKVLHCHSSSHQVEEQMRNYEKLCFLHKLESPVNSSVFYCMTLTSYFVKLLVVDGLSAVLRILSFWCFSDIIRGAQALLSPDKSPQSHVRLNESGQLFTVSL